MHQNVNELNVMLSLKSHYAVKKTQGNQPNLNHMWRKQNKLVSHAKSYINNEPGKQGEKTRMELGTKLKLFVMSRWFCWLKYKHDETVYQ